MDVGHRHSPTAIISLRNPRAPNVSAHLTPLPYCAFSQPMPAATQPNHHHHHRASRAWPTCLAAFCAALVLLLSLATVSPELHARLHDSCERDHGHSHDHSHDHDTPANDSDHACAVTLFAQGLSLVTPLPALSEPAPSATLAPAHSRDELLLPRPRAFTPPAQAPPFWTAAA